MSPAIPRLPLEALFDCAVECAQGVPARVDDALYAEERELIASAVPKRRAEFGTGRVCARRALAALGAPPGPLLRSADRAPRWPSGVVGSITHTDGFCGAVVALSSSARALGLDAERDVPLEPALEPTVCTPAELRWLGAQPLRERGGLAKLVFSAKEAFYKCQHAITGAYLDFLDVDLAVNLDAERFEIAAIRRAGTDWGGVQGARGRFRRGAGLILTGVTL